MSNSVLTAAVALRDALGVLQPECLSGADCARLADELALTEKVCATVRLLVAARAVGAGAHRERGFNDGAAWVARQSGTTAGQARQSLQTADRLSGCSDTLAALVGGEISLAQATEITQADADTPGAETVLLPLARRCDLSQLRDHAREHRQAHSDPAELRQRQYRSRQFRNWRDRDGMVRFSGAMPPEMGLPMVKKIEASALRLRRAARASETDQQPSGFQLEPFEAYAADALADLVAGAASDQRNPGSRPTELVVVIDIFAWRRGHTHPGEVCHIVDGGPIPVDVARELGRDAFVKAVLHDGVNIHTVKHFGRYLPAVLRTALDLGPVPQFSGRQCVDCGKRGGLQYDHVDPVAHHGPTQYDNLQPRCWIDHQAKTERDREAGLLGPHPPPRRRQ